MARWKAIVSYTPEHMPDTIVEFDEYDELGNKVELGPDWQLIDAIQVTLNKN